MDGLTSKRLPRIGVVATDTLRVLGLQTILDDGELCEIVPLSPPGMIDASGLALAIIDATAIRDVVEMVGTLGRLRPQLGLIVLGIESDMEHIQRVIGAGAKGYVSHSADETEVRMAIRVVLDGSVWAPRKVLVRLLEHSRKEAPAAAPTPAVKFTRRELEVLRLLMLGHPNRQIASALGVDEGTVKAHMGRLMRKAGVDNRTALSMRAIERQWA